MQDLLDVCVFDQMSYLCVAPSYTLFGYLMGYELCQHDWCPYRINDGKANK